MRVYQSFEGKSSEMQRKRNSFFSSKQKLKQNLLYCIHMSYSPHDQKLKYMNRERDEDEKMKKESESSHAVQAIESDDEDKKRMNDSCLFGKGSNFHHFHLNETHPFMKHKNGIHPPTSTFRYHLSSFLCLFFFLFFQFSSSYLLTTFPTSYPT